MTSVDEINVTGLSFNESDNTSLSTDDAKTYYTNSSPEEKDDPPIRIHLEQRSNNNNSSSSSSNDCKNIKKEVVLTPGRVPVLVPPLPTIKEVDNSATTEIDHSWSTPETITFEVRSQSYLDDKVKVASGDVLFQSRGVDFFMTEEVGPSNIGRHDGILGGNLRKKPTLIINFRFPWGVLVFYYEIQSKYLPLLRQKYVVVDSPTDQEDNLSYEDFTKQYNTPHDKAMYNFIMGDDAYRNSKLKLIPKVVDGNIIVRKLVYGKPVIIGKKLPISYAYEPANPSKGKAEYWEMDLDVGSSSVRGQKVVGLCKKYVTSMTLDMAFLIECDCEKELPERVFACSRIHHLDPKMTQMIKY